MFPLKKTIILTTSAGTQGIHKAIHADEVITGAFVNAGAIARYIQKQQPQFVSLLCTEDGHPENEDVMCAKYIMSLLRNRPMDFLKIQTYMKTHPSADGFLLHPMTKWSRKDFDFCMSCDIFDFIIKAKKGDPIISPEKTPGSAGGLTEFDSSGNMFLKLASAVQIGCPRHDEYLPRTHQLSERWGS